MTIDEIARDAARSLGMHIWQAQVLLRECFARIATLPVGETIVVREFGTFRKMIAKPRVFRTPAGFNDGTLVTHKLPAVEVLKFRAHKGPAKKRAKK